MATALREAESPPSASCPTPLEIAQRLPATESFVATLGNTSLMEVPGPPGGARIFAKCEWENPTGSVKDRAALAMVAGVLNDSAWQKQPTCLLEYSGGNLARALLALQELIGFPLHLVLPEGVRRALGPEFSSSSRTVSWVTPEAGFVGVVNEAIHIAEEKPTWHFLYQHRNPLNVATHRDTTGAEIIQQLGALKADAWVASIGSGGTLMGVRAALLKSNQGVQVFGVTPTEMPYGTSRAPSSVPLYPGATGLGHGIKQPHVRPADNQVSQVTVSREESLRAIVAFHSLTGVPIGPSAAANWTAAGRVAASLPSDSNVITLFPDAGTEEDQQLARLFTGAHYSTPYPWEGWRIQYA